MSTYVGTRGGGSPVPPPGREGGAGGARPAAGDGSPGRLGTAGAGRPAAGGAGGARLAADPAEAAAGIGPPPIGAPLTGRRLGPPGDGGDARWAVLLKKNNKKNKRREN